MSRFEHSMPAAYFDEMYAADPDPWHFAESDYERDKYDATIAGLPRERYDKALEVGCSIGVFTRRLSARCNALLAIDAAPAALRQARCRCSDLDHTRFDVMRVPGDWPSGPFDLIVLSEIVYYLDRADVRRLATRVLEAIAPAGDIVLVHWLGETHYPLTGDEAADAFIASMAPGARALSHFRADAYRLDVLRAVGDR